MQESDIDIATEGSLELVLTQRGAIKTIVVSGLVLGPFELNCELEPMIQDLEDQDLQVVLRGSSTRLRSLELHVRYDALRHFVLQQLSTHRAISRVRVIAEENGLGIMGVWTDADSHTPFGMRLDFVAGFDSEVDLVFSRVGLYGNASISPIDLVQIVADYLSLSRVFEPIGPQVYHGSPLSTILRQAAPLYGWKVPQWHDCRLAQQITSGDVWTLSFVSGPEITTGTETAISVHPDALYTLDQTLRHRDAEQDLLAHDGRSAPVHYFERLLGGDTSRWVAERAFQSALGDSEQTVKLLDAAERWLSKDERSTAARALMVSAALQQNNPAMAERLLFEFAELPVQSRVHRRLGRAELYALRLAIAQVAVDVDPQQAREHYERVLAQSPDSVLAYESLARLCSRLGDTNAAIDYAESYLVHESDGDSKFEFLLFLGQEHLRQDDGTVAATHVYQQALHLRPGDRRVLTALADLALHRDDHAGALRYLSKLSTATDHTVDPDEHIELLLKIAGLWQVSFGDQSKAIDYLREALALQPLNTRVIWPLVELLRQRDEEDEAITLVTRLADCRVEDFEAPADAILEANHWLLKHGHLNSEETLIRYEHLHATDPADSDLAHKLWSLLLERKLEARAAHLASSMVEHSVGTERADWLYRAAQLEAEVLVRPERASELVARLVTEHADHRDTYSLVLEHRLVLSHDEMVAGYQSLKGLSFEAGFTSRWAEVIARRLDGENAWNWFVIAAGEEPRVELVEELVRYAHNDGRPDKLALAFEFQAIEREHDIDEWLRAAAMWEEAEQSDRLLELLTLGVNANPGNQRLTLRLADQLHQSIGAARAWELIHEALRHVEDRSEAYIAFQRAALKYSAQDARLEAEASALLALVRCGAAEAIEIARLSTLLESMGRHAELAQIYDQLSQAPDATATTRRQDRLRAAQAFQDAGDLKRAGDILLVLMDEDGEVSLEAARALAPLAANLGESSRQERALEYQIANEGKSGVIRCLEELLYLHMRVRSDAQASQTARRLLDVDSSSPVAHRFAADKASRTAQFEECLHHLSSLLFARGRERGLTEAELKERYVEATSLAEIYEPRLGERLRADFDLEFPSEELTVIDLIEDARKQGNWRQVESFLKSRQAWSTGANRDALVVERAEIMVEHLDRLSDAMALLERSINLEEIPHNRIWDALKSILIEHGELPLVYNKALSYMELALNPEQAFGWAMEAVTIAGSVTSMQADGRDLLVSLKDMVPQSLRAEYRATLRSYALFETLIEELSTSLDDNWRVDDGRFKELVGLLESQNDSAGDIEHWAERAIQDFPYLDQGFEILEKLYRGHRDLDALFRLYERWSESREGDSRYELIRRVVDLSDDQGDIRRSFETLRPAVELVEHPVAVLEELYTRATQLNDLSAARDVLDDLSLAVFEPEKKRDVWSRLFDLATGPLDSLLDARRAFEGLESPLELLESFARILVKHDRYPELARTIELVLEQYDSAEVSADVLGPILCYLVTTDGANYDDVSSRLGKLDWSGDSKIERFRSWMNQAVQRDLALYLGLHILDSESSHLGIRGVSDALEALAVQEGVSTWVRQNLAQQRPESFRLAVSIFDAMWPEDTSGALYWLSRSTDLSSDAQMLKLLETRERTLCLDTAGVQWLSDRQDLLSIDAAKWIAFAEYAEGRQQLRAATRSWMNAFLVAEHVSAEQALHVVTLAIGELHDFEFAGRIVEISRFEHATLQSLVSYLIQDGDVESALGWLERAERFDSNAPFAAEYRRRRMILSLETLDDYDQAYAIADEVLDQGSLLEALADALAARTDHRAVMPFETAIDRSDDRVVTSRRCSKLFAYALEHDLSDAIQFALLHTFEPSRFFELLTDKALENGNPRASFEWLLEWGKSAADEEEQEVLYHRALELALHQCNDVQLARRVMGQSRRRADYVDKVVQFYIAQHDYLEAVNELERASDLTSDTNLVQAWLEHAVDLSLNRLQDLDGAKTLAEMAPEPIELLERVLTAAFQQSRESLGLEVARELIDAASERAARDKALRLLLDYVDEPVEVMNALRRLSEPSVHEKRRLVELLLAESDFDALTTMSHWGEVVDARTIVSVAALLSQHGEKDAALRWLEPLLGIHPAHDDAWNCLDAMSDTPGFETNIGRSYIRWAHEWSPNDPHLFRLVGWSYLLRAGRRDLLPEIPDIERELSSLTPNTTRDWLAFVELALLIDDSELLGRGVTQLAENATYGEPEWFVAHERGHQIALRENDVERSLEFAKALCLAQPGRLDYTDWYVEALRRTNGWSELQLFMEEQLESGLSDATAARELIAESLFELEDDEAGLEVMLRIDSDGRDRQWAKTVWDASARLGRSESAYEAATLFAGWESGVAKAEWLRTAARIALWDLAWIDEGRRGLEAAHAIHHDAVDIALDELSTLDSVLRVRRYRELSWVWQDPDLETVLLHWLDWAIDTQSETLEEVFKLCDAAGLLNVSRWLRLLSVDGLLDEPSRIEALERFALENPKSYREAAPLVKSFLDVGSQIRVMGQVEALLQQEPVLRADVLFDLALIYELQLKDTAKALGIYIQGIELSPRLDQQMKVAELSYDLGYFSRTVDISRSMLPQLDETSEVGIRLAQISFESALEIQEERDIERIGDYLLRSNIMTLEAFDAWMTYLNPSWLRGRIDLCTAWMAQLSEEEALKAVLIARSCISVTAPDVWRELVESQTQVLNDNPEFQVLRLPWLGRDERLELQTPLLFQRPDLFEPSKFDNFLFESAAWSLDKGLHKQFDSLTEYADLAEPRWMRLLLRAFNLRDDALGAALHCLERMQGLTDEPLMRRLEAQLGHRAHRLMLKGVIEDVVVLHEALIESTPFLFTERLSREVAWFLQHDSSTAGIGLDDLYWAEVTSSTAMLNRIADKRLDDAFSSMDLSDVDDASSLAERLARNHDVMALKIEVARQNPDNHELFQRAVAAIVALEDAYRLDEFLREFDDLRPEYIDAQVCLTCGDALMRLGLELEASYWFERALKQSAYLSRADGRLVVDALLEKNPESRFVLKLIRDRDQDPRLRLYAIDKLLDTLSDPAALEECRSLHCELAPDGRIALQRAWAVALEERSLANILKYGQNVFPQLSDDAQRASLELIRTLVDSIDQLSDWDIDFEPWYGRAVSQSEIIAWCGDATRGPRMSRWLAKHWSPRIEELLSEAEQQGLISEIGILTWALELDAIDSEQWTTYGSRLLVLAPEVLTWPHFERLAASLNALDDRFGAIQALESAVEEIGGLQPIESLLELIRDDEELRGRSLELRESRVRLGSGQDDDYRALGMDAFSRNAFDVAISHFDAIQNREDLKDDLLKAWARTCEAVGRSEEAVSLWERVGATEAENARSRMSVELAEASGDERVLIEALTKRVRDADLDSSERREAAERVRELGPELDAIEEVQSALQYLEESLTDAAELEAVREERIVFAESQNDYELAAEVLERLYEASSSDDRLMVAERLESLLRIDVGDETRADRLLVSIAVRERIGDGDVSRALNAAERLEDMDAWLSIVRAQQPEGLEGARLIKWAQLEAREGERTKASELYVQALSDERLLPLYVDEARAISEDLGDRAQMRSYDWSLYQTSQSQSEAELLRFLDTWYLEDGPLVDEAVSQLQAADASTLRSIGESFIASPEGYSQAAWAYREITRRSPNNLDDSRTVARLAGNSGNIELAYLHYRHIAAVRPTDEEAQRYLVQCGLTKPRFERALSESEEAMIEVMAPHLDWYWELFAAINEVLAEEGRDLERGYGIDRERDLLEATDPRVETVAHALEWFGLPSVEVYRWRGGGYRCVVQLGDVTRVLVGSTLATDADERELYAAAIYSAAMSFAGVDRTLGLETEALEVALQGLAHAVVGEQPLMTMSDESLRRSGEFSRSMPGMILSGLNDSVDAYVKRHSALGLADVVSALRLRALRFTLLATGGDCELTATAYLRLHDLDGWELEDRHLLFEDNSELKRLQDFHVSWEHSALRRELGLAFRQGDKD